MMSAGPSKAGRPAVNRPQDEHLAGPTSHETLGIAAIEVPGYFVVLRKDNTDIERLPNRFCTLHQVADRRRN